MKKIIIYSGMIAAVAVSGAAGYLVYGQLKHQRSDTARSVGSSAATKKNQTLPAQSADIAAKESVKIPQPPPVSAERDKMIVEIRHELQSVMDLNKQINNVQTSSSAQMLRIQEQAQIHQKILADIQAATNSKKSQAPSREALLAQEKLRIIREETMRNKKILESKTQVARTSAT